MRGDNQYYQDNRADLDGPPPHAWGQHQHVDIERGSPRSTPTCVGTTGVGASDNGVGSVHPHMRGDNATHDLFDNGNDRSTPTCVGTTAARIQALGPPAVHPHMRGDNTRSGTRLDGVHGPPPHAWGQQQLDDGQATYVRSTPTCVGTTAATKGSQNCTTVHPHMRGDNFSSPTCIADFIGPPPHAWGQRKCQQHKHCRARSTPTCVGTTRSRTYNVPSSPVHPHMRGDNASAAARFSSVDGPPPHAWGQHRLREMIFSVSSAVAPAVGHRSQLPGG